MYYKLGKKIINDTDYKLDFKENAGRPFLAMDGKNNYYQILDKSEHLYDLIEVGDLIKYDGRILEVLHLTIKDNIVIMETSKGIHLPSIERLLELITAIYKLDSDGDYIKVWEA